MLFVACHGRQITLFRVITSLNVQVCEQKRILSGGSGYKRYGRALTDAFLCKSLHTFPLRTGRFDDSTMLPVWQAACTIEDLQRSFFLPSSLNHSFIEEHLKDTNVSVVRLRHRRPSRKSAATK